MAKTKLYISPAIRKQREQMARKARESFSQPEPTTPQQPERTWKDGMANQMRQQPTAGEARLWRSLEHGIDGQTFERQVLLSGYIVDFYCAEARLVVEVDGLIHERQRTQDEHRDANLAKRGIETLRFSEALVSKDMGFVLQMIRQSLKIKGKGRNG